MKTFYVSTAIDYPNGRPHLGHAYEKVIADALARWHKLLGEETYFVTGTDENSQKIPQAAQAAGKDAHEFLEENVAIFKELCAKLNAHYSRFIRTTEPAHHRVAQELYNRVHKKGDIYKGTYEGFYCVGCERFYTEKDLDDNRCRIHDTPVQVIKEDSYFFKLSKYQQQLIDHISNHPRFIQPAHKKNEILNRLKEPLHDLSISRKSIDWGIPLPTDPEHVMYVWFDALTNYISALDFPSKEFDKFWNDASEIVHIIGKDITWFHTVIWPIMLLAADVPLPTVVHSHGFVNLKGKKLSKSSGVSVDPLDLIDQYGEDALRYYLLREIPAGQDGDFSEEALIDRANADLADALGNLANRGCVLCQKYYDGHLPENATFGVLEKALEQQLKQTVNNAKQSMESFEWHRAIEHIWSFIHAVNKYVNDTAAWKEQDEHRRESIVYTIIESIRCISILTRAFIPQTSELITTLIGQEPELLEHCELRTTTRGQTTPGIAFAKIEKRDVEEDPFSAINLKVGVVRSVENHPNADKLYIIQVDLGTEQRQIVSGIRDYITADDLKDKHVIVVTNLKPAKLRGVKSDGMLLAADKGQDFALIEATHAPAGTQVAVKYITPSTDTITFDTFTKIKLITKGKRVLYHDKELLSNGKPVTADIADGATVR